MQTEAKNEALKLIASAKERINKYLLDNDIDNSDYLEKAYEELSKAIDRLAG